jgi:hypothetical protein
MDVRRPVVVPNTRSQVGYGLLIVLAVRIADLILS